MRILTLEEMAAVSGGHYTDKDGTTHIDRVSVGGDGGRSDSAGGGRDNMGHSVARQTNRDEVTGYVVFPGGEAGKTGRYVNGEFTLEGFSVGAGTSGVNGTVNFKKRESHN
ncbi:hypothetical protein OIV19_20455 [Brucella sp. HL-2]|nr:hypothetical protein [Brucella sp. HL-2]MCV9909974.1 hypothetical protein [Brucella sp. HL-2]